VIKTEFLFTISILLKEEKRREVKRIKRIIKEGRPS